MLLMKKAVLIIGYGPYGYCLAKKLESLGYTIIMTMIEANSQNQTICTEFNQIKVKDLHAESCKNIYENCMNILKEKVLELEYIIHTARFSAYEFNKDDEFSEDIKDEMFKVNSESPQILAQLFFHTGCKFVFTSSGASMGFNKNLAKKVVPKQGKKRIGTLGLKHYSYVKRVGEEKLYEFFKEKNRLDLLVIIYIAFMSETNFFKDMNVTDLTVKALNAEQIANNVVKGLLKGRNKIYADGKAKALSYLPCPIIALFLNYTMEKLHPLDESKIKN